MSPMRPTVALAALLTLAALAVPAAPAAPMVDVDASVQGTVPVDLVGDAAATLLFRFREANFTSPSGAVQSAAVRLTHQGEPPLELAMTRQPDGNWTVPLAVSTPDFVAGTWQAAFVALRPAGASVLATRAIDAEARDTQPPQLALAQAVSPVVLGPGEAVDLTVKDPLLRKVTFELPGLLPVALPAPYSLSGEALPEGRSEVTFTAYDRAAHKTVLTADLVRDTRAPAVNLTVPEHVYDGVPFIAYARVAEAGPYTVRFTSNGTRTPDVQVTGEAAPGVNRTTAFTVKPDQTGNLTLSIEVVDQAGFVNITARHLAVERPVTDLHMSRLATQPAGPQFAQRAVLLTATLEQERGVAKLPVPVTLSVGGQSFSSVEDLAASGPRTLRWEVHLPGGQYTALASATVPEGVNETDPGDEEDTFDVEVFLGRLIDNGTAYDIRAGPNGLPSSAVLEGRATTYPLELVSSGRGVAYEFEVGNRTLTWDPLSPMGQEASSTSSSSASSSTGGSKPASAAGPLVALLVVALAGLAQRRRL